MPKEKDQFLKLTPLEQIDNLTKSTPELVKLISKDTKDLTAVDARSLYDLRILDDQATGLGIKLVANLDNIKKDGFEDFAEKLSEESQEVQNPAVAKSKHLPIENVDTSGGTAGNLNMVDANLNLYNIIANARRKCASKWFEHAKNLLKKV